MAVFTTHHPLVFIIGILGNILSFFVYLAPLPTFYRVYKTKSTEGFQSVPYVAALFSAMLWVYYSITKANGYLLTTINSLGCLIEIVYLAIFISFAPRKTRNATVRLFVGLNVGLLSVILLLTHFMVKGSTRVKVLGWISAAISVAFFAAPLCILTRVIQTRSVEFMPFSLSLSLTLSAITWLSYGLLIKDYCVAVPNTVGALLGLVQMALYGVYRNASTEKLPTEVHPEIAKFNCHKENDRAGENEGSREHKTWPEARTDGNGGGCVCGGDEQTRPAEDAV